MPKLPDLFRQNNSLPWMLISQVPFRASSTLDNGNEDISQPNLRTAFIISTYVSGAQIPDRLSGDQIPDCRS